MTSEKAKEKIVALKGSMRNSGIFSSDIFEALDIAIEAIDYKIKKIKEANEHETI